MNSQKQTMAIAEACPEIAEIDKDNGGVFWKSDPSKEFDPGNDLNAMHEVEKWLCGARRNDPFANADRYFRELAHICNPSCDLSNESNQRPIFATAAQRREAFLKTIKKWEE